MKQILKSLIINILKVKKNKNISQRSEHKKLLKQKRMANLEKKLKSNIFYKNEWLFTIFADFAYFPYFP